MSKCENCSAKTESSTENVPSVVYESAMAWAERSAKRMWVVIILLIVLLVGSNAAWLWYESQFEEITITQENADGYNNFIGNDGDIINGETDNKD